MSRKYLPSLMATLAMGLLLFAAFGADSPSEDPLIDYAHATPSDPLEHLRAAIDSGAVKLPWDKEFGYLPAILEALDVPQSSQMLVFSKTSFQRTRITPRNPRALYFNDDIYVGYVPGGEVLELSAADPKLGAVFYTLQQRPDRARITRMGDDCMVCHESNLTENVPGHIVRSVFPDLQGQPILSAGTFRVNHSTPLKDRWGGWYVTGKSGQQLHMGNQLIDDEDNANQIDRSKGSNLMALPSRVDPAKYLRPTSDIVALMVLEHQTTMHNLITKANYGVRMAERDQQIMNQALGRPANYESESTPGRVKSVCEPLVKYMLFCEETPLTDPIEGVSGFAQEFSSRGPKDPKGRSLYQLDLHKRLFKYPCSYLIYSDAFEALPQRAKIYIHRRLHEILSGKDQSKDFAHLSPADRQAISQILSQTMKGWN